MIPARSHSSTSATEKPENSASRSRVRSSSDADSPLSTGGGLRRFRGDRNDLVDVQPGWAHQRAPELLRPQVCGGGGVDVVGADRVDQGELLLAIADPPPV